MSKVAYDSKSFIIDGRRKFINSGELHYFRIPKSQWEDRLLKCKQAFLNTLGAYTAWNWHEEEQGKFNFEGDRDLGGWISLAEKVGLLIFIRPGPYICSEWDFGGFPNWLIAKDCELRSLERNYMRYCMRYLSKIHRIIKPHLITRGGKIFLYQVENEFEVGDIPYHLRLKEIAENDGIDVPICTNENRWVRGTDIIEGPDPYLRSWLVSEATNKIKELLKTQPDKPPFAPEVGTHMFIKFYGQLPFSDGYRPPQLDEVYLKSLIAAGVSGFNWYMYHGGTNIGYWGGRDIATSYDFDAPIREWGELGERYDISRRIGGFLESFGKEVLETESSEEECCVDENGVDVYLRKDKEKAFIFLSNPYARERSFKVTLKDPLTNKKLDIPEKGKYRLPGYSMTILPVRLRITSDLSLLYTTSEIFYFVDNGDEKILILYRDKGIPGEIAFRKESSLTVLNYVHDEKPKVIRFENVKLIVINKNIASKTWFFNFQGKKYPVISNVYFFEKQREDGKNVDLTFQAREGKNWLMLPLKLKEIRIDGEKVSPVFKNELSTVSFSEGKFPEFYCELSGKWKVKEENLEAAGEKSWLAWEPWDGLENYGFFKNGYALYKNDFTISRLKRPVYLNLTGFQDEVSVYLNKKYVKSGRDNLSCEISSRLKKGTNHLVILSESGGHHCGGEKSYNGISSPVYLYSEEKDLKLTQWRRKLVTEPYPHKLLVEEKIPEVGSEFDDSGWDMVRVDRKWDSRFFKNPYEECFAWYRTFVNVPDEFSKMSLSLGIDSELKDRVYLYVNGKFAGLRENTFVSLPSVFDLAGRIKKGKNLIVIGIKADRWVSYFGLHGEVKISAYDMCLNRGWKIRQLLGGEGYNFAGEEFDDSGWHEVIVKGRRFPPGSLTWFRKKVKIEFPPGYVSPLRVSLKGTRAKALVFFNGTLIGRYSDKGSQEDFYIYEDIIKEENLIAIFLDGRDSGAELGEITISPYYVAKRVSVELIGIEY